MFWLASYPKSGSTWLRVFLTNLLEQNEKPAHINSLLNTYGANDNNLIEYFTPFEPSELTFLELQKIRVELLNNLPSLLEEQCCIKIHQANIAVSQVPQISLKNQPIIYIVRNPLDVSISLAHHQQWNIQQSISFMNDDKAVLGSINRLNQRLSPEFLSTWSNHYLSWKNSVPHMHLVRYEDMQTNGLKTFSKIVDYLGFDYSERAISQAIEKSDLKNLQKQEQKIRFKEGSIANRHFFRKGEIGEWKSVLSPEQVDSIVAKHRDVMEELGYL